MQDKEGWYGLTLTATDRDISDVRVYPGSSLDELKNLFDKQPCGVALDDATGYLFNLNLPFKGRRKIGLVLGGQLEEMLPSPIDEMVLDFQELGADGAILAAAIPRSSVTDLGATKDVRNVSLQSLAALYAVRCFKLLPPEHVVFIHCTGNSAVIMVFDGQRLIHLRHFFRSSQAAATISALREIADLTDLSDARYLMIGAEDGPIEQQSIETALGITVELLELSDYISGENVQGQSWAGVGSALMALNPKGEIDLSMERHRPLSDSDRLGLYLTAGLAGVSLLALGLCSLDLYLKQRTYSFLSSEPNRIYRAAFPKVPPVRDVVRTFEEKIESLNGTVGNERRNENSALSLLDEISGKIEAQLDVKLSEFSFDEKEFAVAGTTISFVSIDKIKDALQQAKGARSVELQSIDKVPGGQVKFKFKGNL